MKLTPLKDWVQDAAREQIRRKVRKREKAGFFERGGHAGWRYSLWESYDAAQAWIVVTIIGMRWYRYSVERHADAGEF